MGDQDKKPLSMECLTLKKKKKKRWTYIHRIAWKGTHFMERLMRRHISWKDSWGGSMWVAHPVILISLQPIIWARSCNASAFHGFSFPWCRKKSVSTVSRENDFFHEFEKISWWFLLFSHERSKPNSTKMALKKVWHLTWSRLYLSWFRFDLMLRNF